VHSFPSTVGRWSNNVVAAAAVPTPQAPPPPPPLLLLTLVMIKYRWHTDGLTAALNNYSLSAIWPQRAGGRVAGGHEGDGVWERGVPLPTGGAVWGRRKFLEFSSKKCRVLCILLQKTTCDQKLGPRGLIDLLGAENVKRTGVENLAGGSTPTTPRQLASCYVDWLTDASKIFTGVWFVSATLLTHRVSALFCLYDVLHVYVSIVDITFRVFWDQKNDMFHFYKIVDTIFRVHFLMD